MGLRRQKALRSGGGTSLTASVVSPIASPLFFLLALGIAILVLLFVLRVLRLREEPNRKVLASVVAVGLALAALGSFMGYGMYQSYVSSNTWTFSYYVYIQPNSTASDAVVLPSIADEALLAGLSVSSGTANWSFVHTDHGRAIYIGFTGNVALSALISRYPPPNPLPDTQITMANESIPWPEAWIYYPGTAGLWLSFGTNAFGVSEPIHPGWNLYPFVPRPVPVS
jgi:hypothetical protein